MPIKSQFGTCLLRSVSSKSLVSNWFVFSYLIRRWKVCLSWSNQDDRRLGAIISRHSRVVFASYVTPQCGRYRADCYHIAVISSHTHGLCWLVTWREKESGDELGGRGIKKWKSKGIWETEGRIGLERKEESHKNWHGRTHPRGRRQQRRGKALQKHIMKNRREEKTG